MAGEGGQRKAPQNTLGVLISWFSLPTGSAHREGFFAARVRLPLVTSWGAGGRRAL